MTLLRSLLHHSEAIDPVLAGWIRDKIDDIFGLPPAVIALALGAGIVAIPIALATAALRRRDRDVGRGVWRGEP